MRRSLNRATVELPNGTIRQVRNLGYVLRNWRQIERLEWRSNPPRSGYPMLPEGLFIAYFRDKRVYRIEYASFQVWRNFIDRPVFRGLPIVVNGIEGTV